MPTFHSIPRLAQIALVVNLAAACTSSVDGPIPHGYEDLVNGARASLRANQEGLFPPTLSFATVRCFANGGHVVVFRQGAGDAPEKVAFALQGPGATVDGWGGGFGAEGMAEEIAFNFANVPEIACPPR